MRSSVWVIASVLSRRASAWLVAGSRRGSRSLLSVPPGALARQSPLLSKFQAAAAEKPECSSAPLTAAVALAPTADVALGGYPALFWRWPELA